MAFIITPNGIEIPIQPHNSKAFVMEEIHEIVGGFFEILPAYDGRVLLVNEDRKNRNLPINNIATQFYQYNDKDFISGTALICERSQIE